MLTNNFNTLRKPFFQGQTNSRVALSIPILAILLLLVLNSVGCSNSRRTSSKSNNDFWGDRLRENVYKDGMDYGLNASAGGPLPSYSDYSGKNRGPGTGPRYFNRDK